MEKRQIITVEFVVMLVTMIVGGLVYSIASFSYLHASFPTAKEVEYIKSSAIETNVNVDRLEVRIEKRLDSIEKKIDMLMEK